MLLVVLDKYKCKLINPTQEYKYVIIKVKHPNVDEEAKDFSKLVSWFTYLQSKYYFRKKLCLYFDFEEFMNNINSQIDLNIEANNGKKFKNYILILILYTFLKF